MATKPPEDLKASAAVGCGAFAMKAFTTIPMWYVLMFGILERTEAPTWQWIVFWIYMPTGIFLSLVDEFVKYMRSKGD